jgi:hypothetical protein
MRTYGLSNFCHAPIMRMSDQKLSFFFNLLLFLSRWLLRIAYKFMNMISKKFTVQKCAYSQYLMHKRVHPWVNLMTPTNSIVAWDWPPDIFVHLKWWRIPTEKHWYCLMCKKCECGGYSAAAAKTRRQSSLDLHTERWNDSDTHVATKKPL